MKRESQRPRFGRGGARAPDAGSVAVRVLDRLATDPERLGRFLALTGLDPATIREAASGPDFLAAVLDYVVSDEQLLLAIADETDLAPDAIAEAQSRLSPVAEWSP